MEDNDTQKPIIIKIGGSILKNPNALDSLFSFINKNKQFNWLIVHGGGNVVDSWLNKMGYISKKHDGLRISSEKEMPIIAFPHYENNSKVDDGFQWHEFINKFSPQEVYDHPLLSEDLKVCYLFAFSCTRK